MTPQEKANELFNKYFFELRLPSDCEGCMQCIDRCGNMVAVAKKYALIAIDEIINTDCLIDEDGYVMKPSYIQYWQEVLNELNKM